MKNYKNIIFDLGGIFIDIDYFKTENAFIDMGVTNFANLYTQHHASPLFEELETGKITPQQFYNNFREISGLDLADDKIEYAWNAMLGTFAPEKLDWLLGIKERYNIYLLSNTNLIHYNAFQETFRKSTGKHSFDDYFKKAWYSHTLGLRKPYPATYQHVMQQENLLPEETVFIDDTPKNIDGAKIAGLHTILLQHPETVLDLDL